MCNHDYVSDDNTLIGIPSLKMVYPPTYYLKCKECGTVITINHSDIKDIKGFLQCFFGGR
jgi:hypothetical protein